MDSGERHLPSHGCKKAMVTVLAETLLPIFTIIALGSWLQTKQLLSRELSRELNKLVYYVAIPAMLVTKLEQASFASSFTPATLGAATAALPLVWLQARWIARRLFEHHGRRSTFVQCCIHGNLGYLGYAVAYYALNEEAFRQTVVLGGFLMIEQNVLAILAYTARDSSAGKRPKLLPMFRPVLENPVILSVLMGLMLALGGWRLPLPLQRSLTILAGMSFPMALLLIGAGLAFGEVHTAGRELLAIGFMKLVLLPLTGWVLLYAFGAPGGSLLPALILLASPPATVTYVFATGMNGDPELAAAAVSLHTLLSALAYGLLLVLVPVLG